MASDAIDAAAEHLSRPVPDSCTAELPLIGADGWHDLAASSEGLADRHGLPHDLVDRLLWRHGSCIHDVLAIAEADPALKEILPGGRYLAAEIVHGARNEGALHLDDMLARRMRISFENPQRGLATAEYVAQIMANELGWSTDETAAEIELWSERVNAELAANQAPNDEAADALRSKVTDARRVINI